MSMIRKYHNHTLQINPWHKEEEPQTTNSHKTPGRPIKMTAKLEGHTKYCMTKQEPSTELPKTLRATINNKLTTTEPPP